MSTKTKIQPYETLSEDQKTVSIPYYIHEGEMYRVERLNRRWFIAFLIVLVMLFVTNAGWIIYDHQFETYQVEQAVDTGTGAAYIAGVGDVNYGQDNTESNGSGQAGQQQ